MKFQAAPPFHFFTDASGNALEDGYVYFGEPNQNPQTNPISVYWDAAGTIQAAQPLRTSGGYLWRNGSPGSIYTDGEYSITVRDRNGNLVASNLSMDPSSGLSLEFLQAGTGAVPRTMQDKERDIVSVKDFGATGDGTTNDTAAFLACKLFCETAPYKTMFIPNGTYMLTPPSTNGMFYCNLGKLRVEGESVPGTILKAANNTGGMFRVQIQDFYLSGVTIDCNSKSGTFVRPALWLEGNQPVVRNIRVINYVGSTYPAVLIDLANLVELHDFRIEDCETGLQIGRDYQTLYSRISNGVIAACSTGLALKMYNCVGQVFDNVIIESGPLGAMHLDTCYAVDFFHFQMETGSTTLTANSVILLEDCEQINFTGVRINQQHQTINKKLIQYIGFAYDISWTNVYALNTTTGWTLFAAEGSSMRNLTWRNIRAYSSVAMVGISNAPVGVNIDGYVLDGWDSGGSGPFTHTIKGYRAFINDVDDVMTLDDQETGGVIINCSGTLTLNPNNQFTRLGFEGGYSKVAVKTDSQAWSSDTTLANITQFPFYINAAETKIFSYKLRLGGALASTGLKIAMTGPASFTGNIQATLIVDYAAAVTENLVQGSDTITSTLTFTAAALTGSSYATLLVFGRVVGGGTAGTCALQMAEETAASVLNVFNGSTMEVDRII